MVIDPGPAVNSVITDSALVKLDPSGALALLGTDPRPASALLRATLLRALGRGDEASGVLEEAVRREPGSPELLGAMASACVTKGDFRAAAGWAERLIAVEPDSPEGWLALAEIHLLRDELAVARGHAATALSLDPGNPDAERLAIRIAALIDAEAQYHLAVQVEKSTPGAEERANVSQSEPSPAPAEFVDPGIAPQVESGSGAPEPTPRTQEEPRSDSGTDEDPSDPGR